MHITFIIYETVELSWYFKRFVRSIRRSPLALLIHKFDMIYKIDKIILLILNGYTLIFGNRF